MKPARSLVIQSMLGERSTGMNIVRVGKMALELHDFRKNRKGLRQCPSFEPGKFHHESSEEKKKVTLSGEA